MIEIELDGVDLGRARFAADPLWEAIASLSVMQRPRAEAVHGRLREHFGLIDRSSMWLLNELCGDPRWFPDFLGPEPISGRRDPEARVAQVADADLEIVRGDLDVVRRYLPQSPLLDLSPQELRRAAAAAMHVYWTAVMAPLWGRLEALADADIAYRSSQLATEGLAATVGGLHERIKLEHNTIRVQAPTERRVRSRGGLWLVPSVFQWPTVAVQYSSEMPVLCYPARGSGLLWEHPRRPTARLDRLLGRTRAEVLRRTDLPMSTTALADAVGLSKPTVNGHLRVLADGGLVRARRQGKQVLYERTNLGDDVLRSSI
ncbi:ArsR/SmtB family transcription factor [Luteipulveratus mongoliensis]|uniref:ArsR/SmtB family transcription factor n=1 Tax=Luteipulveratus mongoliensis TaxID=571913 RepID=UPI0012ED1CFA|nr:DUF5937 family protein [Luteipulveratus mongoliensis]